jgi:transposase
VTAREAVVGELAAWAAHRTRRVQARTATTNQLLGQLVRAFPGLTLVLPAVLGTKVGRLVAAEFAGPKRFVALGTARFIPFAAARGLHNPGWSVVRAGNYVGAPGDPHRWPGPSQI